MGEGERCLLHFEAVDFACACCVNGQVVGTHEGGYLPFSFDITEALRAEDSGEECGSAFQGAEAAGGDVAVEGAGDAKSDACGRKGRSRRGGRQTPAPPRVRGRPVRSRPERCGHPAAGQAEAQVGRHLVRPKAAFGSRCGWRSFPLAACWPWRCIPMPMPAF
ncbi:MAG: sugar-binding domain-containing protein [Adlercreutzia equolifaciens]